MRILIAPVEVSGIAGGLKAGFDRIGIEAEIVFSQPHPFAYRRAATRRLVPRIWLGLASARFAAGRGRLGKALLLLAWKAWSVMVLAWALARFDGFVFLHGNTLTNTRLEAWLLARLGKKVVVIYCGSDARPPYVDGQVYWDTSRNSPANVARLAAMRSERIALHERYGFICVNSPFTGQFHAAPYVSWFAMGIPRAFADARDASDAGVRPGPAVRILHSPSNPPLKGTPRITELVEGLKSRGHAVELVLLRNVPHHQVLSEVAKADLIVDQIYSDTPMAGFAGEAAHCGKAVLVAGYAAGEELGETIRATPPPTLFVHPDGVGEALERLVSDEAFRKALGRQVRDFVDSHWSAEAVAGRYLRLLTDGPPEAWTIAPEAVSYVHGGGLAEADARKFVAELLRSCGPGALHLDHKPALREAFVAFAEGRDAEPSP
jgi:glycosyltransferase involved in cell wall biosynthesis